MTGPTLAEETADLLELRQVWGALGDLRARLIRLDVPEAADGVIAAELAVGEELAGRRQAVSARAAMETTPAPTGDGL